MRHDPERVAAAYLSGELSPGRRDRLESHMLECDACWREVSVGRRGRAIAEAQREVAPQRVRERVRGVAATVPDRQPRRWPGLRLPLLVTASGLAVLLVALVTVLAWSDSDRRDQPVAIADVVAAYRQAGGEWSANADPPARRIEGLSWRGSRTAVVGGQPATLHLYTDGDIDGGGDRLLVVRSPRRFPQAAHAEPLNDGPNWIARSGGAVVFCADRAGFSWLAVGQSRARVLAAGDSLGLRRSP